MTLTTLYLISILPNLGTFLLVLAVLSFALFLWIGAALMDHPKEKCLIKYTLITGSVSLFFFILGSLIPTTSQMYLLVGGYLTTHNEEMQKLPKNVLGAANAWLESIEKEQKKRDQ